MMDLREALIRRQLSTAGMLALAALTIVTLVVTVVIIASIDGSDEGSGIGNGSWAAASDCTPRAEKAVQSGYYVIKDGEGLSDVAYKTCVGIDRTERLNPNLDPMALPPRGCVDLVKDGCKVLAARG